MSWKTNFLKKKSEAKIEELISQFEKLTGIELFISIAKSSHPYPAATLRFAIISALLFSWATNAYIEISPAFLLLVYFFILLFPFVIIGRTPFFKRFGLSNYEMEREVKEKSVELFALHGQTSHGKIILLYISILEKEFELLVGPSVLETVNQESLEKLSLLLSQEFKKGSAENGLMQMIQALQEHFKVENPEQTPNEIGNHIHWFDFSK